MSLSKVCTKVQHVDIVVFRSVFCLLRDDYCSIYLCLLKECKSLKNSSLGIFLDFLIVVFILGVVVFAVTSLIINASNHHSFVYCLDLVLL